ncbi:MAG: NAD(P)/FAD-dependent oxidoreductase [Candidatus Jordarchaeum sp.]|uniref:NAD(P)/FAD-dependent oxidoreductase n=1 Tax=Candidatus Jordarchaeum sp. TaxID=2823881 RepID=UPI0040497381
MQYDVIVIGSGPAGLASATFTSARKLKTLVLEATSKAGGKPVNMYGKKIVDDFLGFPEGVKGKEVGEALIRQAEKFGAEIKCNSKVTKISIKNNDKLVETEGGEIYRAKAVIIATGSHSKSFVGGIEGEREFRKKGVAYQLSDPTEMENKTVIVVGGGANAVETALILKNIAKKVHIIHRRDNFRADELLVEKLEKSNVNIIYNSQIKKIEGNNHVTKVTIYNNKSNKETEMKADQIIFCIGAIPASEMLKELPVEVDQKGTIRTDCDQKTSVEGIFAAGDVAGGAMRISAAIGEGVKAAMTAYLYIKQPYWA